MKRLLIFFSEKLGSKHPIKLKKARTCEPSFASLRAGLFLTASGARLDIPSPTLGLILIFFLSFKS